MDARPADAGELPRRTGVGRMTTLESKRGCMTRSSSVRVRVTEVTVGVFFLIGMEEEVRWEERKEAHHSLFLFDVGFFVHDIHMAGWRDVVDDVLELFGGIKV